MIAEFATHQWITEVVHVPARTPYLGSKNNGRVDAHHIRSHFYEMLPPKIANILLQLSS